MATSKITIGRIDKADFTEFGLTNIDVKIDTGAYGCSLHCDFAHVIDVDGKPQLEFGLDLGKTHQTFSTKYYSTKMVKSSTGVAEERFLVETTIVLFGKEFKQKFSLSNRADMKFPVLLGRTLLSRNFVVDTARTNLSFKAKIGQK
ncbi:MAG: ATP-dependent zinc protease [Bacteroidetes bacterium]|nr:ATP-dependent zinc protease [Bacteroidota bacterium]